MKLHEAIEKLLKTRGRPMTTSEIAEELNRNKWYTKKDGSLITPFQTHGRTRNYPHLFKRQGSIVAIIDKTLDVVEKSSKTIKKLPFEQIVPSVNTSTVEVEMKLMDKTCFKNAGEIDRDVPAFRGLYCIRIKSPNALPEEFAKELIKRGDNIIYIGKASRSLKRRLLNQELRARGHGSFFRSIGCVLGYKPAPGSIVHKKNKRNFKFSPEDEVKIIDWINENLLINWVEFSGIFEATESILIAKYAPLLNLQGNPLALEELTRLRNECVKLANNMK